MIDHVHVSMSIEEATYKGFRNLAMLQDKKISQIVEQLMRYYIVEQGYKKQEAKYGCNHTAPNDTGHNNPQPVSYYDIRDKERGNR